MPKKEQKIAAQEITLSVKEIKEHGLFKAIIVAFKRAGLDVGIWLGGGQHLFRVKAGGKVVHEEWL